LTHELTSIANPNTIFIYFSSIEVYPKSSEIIFREEDVISVDQSINLYGITKLMSESIVRRNTKKHLIIRPALLIGEFMRPNSVTKIANSENKRLSISLSQDSKFYIVSYEEVLNFIRKVLEKSAWGTYNLLHSDVISLSEVAEIFGANPEWGPFRYHTPRICNLKSTSLLPALSSPPHKNLKEWLK
jgi:dTDP-4-dehydrorhamnose reductase